jgi:UDP-N-acetylmuramyl pentapeptide phosphotransferase/UDP-N-acetylglucosamine-1-phosphate transferase
LRTYLIVYFGAALVAIFATPVVTRLSRRFGLLDTPGLRKVHKSPVPRIGGVVLALATLALILPASVLDNTIGQAFHKVQVQITVLLLASVFVFVVGLIDDIRSVRALFKLIALIGAALAVCVSGARIDSMSFGSVVSFELGWLSWPVTVLWIVTVTVGLNFIDGLDGLAAGISAIVCGVIAVFAFYTGQIVMAVLMLALLGSLTGFLFFNFNPAKVFMGDCGSLFLGFIISAGSVVCVAKAATVVGMAIPAAVLGIPLLDTLFTVIRRGILDRRSIFAAERGHIHHRLLDLGLQQRHAVLVLYGATLLLAGLAMAMLVTRAIGTVALMGGVVLLLLMLFHFVGGARLKETLAALKRNAAIARQVKEEKHCFEDAQLRLREVRSFEGLWQAACDIAEKMGFERLALSQNLDETAAHTSVWRRTAEALSPHEIITVSVPIRNGSPEASVWIEAGLRVDGSLETAGRRLMLFGRLLDEWMTANLMGVAITPSRPETRTHLGAHVSVSEAEEGRV